MFDMTFANLMAWLLAAFFVLGGIGNWRLPPKFRDDYRRWGYPSGFNYLTAVLELLAAALLVAPATRLFGAALGLAVMVAALATLIRHKEHRQAVAPLIVAAVCVAVGWAAL